jgi:hypothetical protein
MKIPNKIYYIKLHSTFAGNMLLQYILNQGMQVILFKSVVARGGLVSWGSLESVARPSVFTHQLGSARLQIQLTFSSFQ